MAMSDTELRYEALRALNAGEPIAVVCGRAQIELSKHLQDRLRVAIENEIVGEAALKALEIAEPR